jgi:trans-aconitate 2-methyltransferase
LSDWDSALYLRFKKERTQPAIDLANRIRIYRPNKIADIGCGPGNSTEVVKSVFPNASVLGIDHSQSMINKARAEHPYLTFQLGEAEDLPCGYDLIFSNACLQWIPDHVRLLPALMGKLNRAAFLRCRYR